MNWWDRAVQRFSATSFGMLLINVADTAAGRTALGLGAAAPKDVGTGAGDVAAGNAPAAAVTAHEDETDPHTQYHTDARGDARYLYRENTKAFTPDGDYEPATKKYVDDNATATPGGADTYLQFNDSGAFGGDADLVFAKTTSQLTAGRGSGAQETLEANLNQWDVTIERDVDGASAYSEAGGLLLLNRDVTNATATNGNFLAWSNDGGSTLLGQIDATGRLVCAKPPTGNYLGGAAVAINPASTASLATLLWVGVGDQERFSLRDLYGDITMMAKKIVFSCGSDMTVSAPAGGASLNIKNGAYGSAIGGFAITGGTKYFDSCPASDSIISGMNAHPSATAGNRDGGGLLLYGGNHADTGGNEGSVKITNADGSTAIAEFNESKIGFFGATPVPQQAKADHNNWANLSDVVNALVNLGLLDAA